MTFPPFEMMGAALRAEGNIWAGYRKDRADWFPEDLLEKHGPEHKAEIVYFAGCTASATSSRTSASARCGCSTRPASTSPTSARRRTAARTPMLVAGKWERFERDDERRTSRTSRTPARTR